MSHVYSVLQKSGALTSGANSIHNNSGASTANKEATIRTQVSEFSGNTSQIIIPIPRIAGEQVFALRVDRFFVSGQVNKNNIMLSNLVKTPTTQNVAYTSTQTNGIWNYNSSLKETAYNPTLSQIYDTNSTGYSSAQDIDGYSGSSTTTNNVMKFIDTQAESGQDRFTYVFDPAYHPYIILRSDDLEARVEYNNTSEGVLGTAIPSIVATAFSSSNPSYIFENGTTQDIARIRDYDHEIKIDLMHHSATNKEAPENLRPDRFLYFTSPYTLTVVLYIRST